MKEHVMNLTPAPMQEIRTGNKTIELRLNDEKRKVELAIITAALKG